MSSTIVVANPLTKYPLQVALRHSHRITPISRLQNATRFGNVERALQDTDSEAFQCPVQTRGDDGVTAADGEAVGMIEGQELRNCCVVHAAVGCSVTLK